MHCSSRQISNLVWVRVANTTDLASFPTLELLSSNNKKLTDESNEQAPRFSKGLLSL